jgi:hypothetical protein
MGILGSSVPVRLSGWYIDGCAFGDPVFLFPAGYDSLSFGYIKYLGPVMSVELVACSRLENNIDNLDFLTLESFFQDSLSLYYAPGKQRQAGYVILYLIFRMKYFHFHSPLTYIT